MQEDKRIFKISAHVFLIVDEVGRQVTTIELHAFNDIEFVFQPAAFFNSDHTFFTHLVHSFGDDVANGCIAIGRDTADLSDGC